MTDAANAKKPLVFKNEFPKDFKWGVATAAYQIEGAVDEDGRGRSIWDTFCDTPGKIARGENARVTTDHYHRFVEDLDLMKDLGIQAYRFSFAWPRMFPNGYVPGAKSGEGNPLAIREQRGFDFYDRLVDKMLENGIEPYATLYHWDLPQTLQDKGGWATREVLQPFADYSYAMGEHFGDRIKHWAPINETWVMSWLGYGTGDHAPGLEDYSQAIAAAHHTVVAHRMSLQALKAANPNLLVGPVLSQTMPDVDDIFDPFQIKVAKYMDAHQNLFWMHSLFRGEYPELVYEMFGDDLRKVIHPGDLDIVKNDWMGINYYFSSRVGHEVPAGHPTRGRIFDELVGMNYEGAPIGPTTDISWPITPQGLGDLLVRWTREYGDVLPPLYITENGVAYDDGPGTDGLVHDQRRIDYLNEYLRSVRRAIDRGADVRGYFQWSFMDNFEWAVGFAKRFGIVHVDYDTQKRTVKQSGRFYADLISTNGRALRDPVFEGDLLAKPKLPGA